jgi:folate-dependent phosphoribosylglycinamide formyltransferase PurN
MKLILFSGNHARHLYVNREILKYFDEALVIIMKREELIPSPPKDLSSLDKKLFSKHFENRNKVETQTYGDLRPEKVFAQTETLYILPEQLNTADVAQKVSDFDADFCFIFGVDLILDPVIDVLPANKVNLHLGISPWYKGAATLYWPFYHLKPQFCGVTFHQITKEPDAGEIIHQSVPCLKQGDTIHDVGAKCVLQAKEDIKKIINHLKIHGGFKGKVQNSSGRNWRSSDFHGTQLRVIYELFNDDIVDHHLSGKLSHKKPFLFTCITET